MKSLSSFGRILCAAFLFAILFSALTGARNAQAANHDVWQIIPSTSVGGASNQLYGVAAIAHNDVWAVGTSLGSSYQHQSLIEHWNGSSWRSVSTPDSKFNPTLKAVAAIPDTHEVWAVGTQVSTSNGSQTLIERWNGKVWQIIPSPLFDATYGPSGGTNILNSVVAISKNNAWATGMYYNNQEQTQKELIEHWNGKHWRIVPTTTISGVNTSLLNAVTACSANNVWVVGQSVGTAGENTLVEHWNGHTWQIIPAKNPGDAANALYGVTCIPGTNKLWTVGNYLQNSQGNYQTLTERWNGKVWQVIASPSIGTFGSNLLSVTALSANNAWAVGSGNDQGLIEQWNGRSWNVVSQPVPSTLNELAAITHVPGNDQLWAVGDYYASDYNSQLTLIEQYS
jgi:hypothetical protein